MKNYKIAPVFFQKYPDKICIVLEHILDIFNIHVLCDILPYRLLLFGMSIL